MALCYFPHYSCKCKFSDVPCVCHAVYFFHILVQGVPQLLGTSHTCCCLTSFHTHPCLEKCMHILSDFELRSESSSDSACSPSFYCMLQSHRSPGPLNLDSQHHLTKPYLYFGFCTWFSTSSSSRF